MNQRGTTIVRSSGLLCVINALNELTLQDMTSRDL